jgi:hypothetical protein
MVDRTIVVGPIASVWLLYLGAVITIRLFFAGRLKASAT